MSKETEVAALGWSYRVTFGPQASPRDLVAQVHIAADATPAQIDELLNKIARAQDRQILFYTLQDMKQRLKNLLKIIHKAERDAVLVLETARQRWESEARKGPWSEDKLSGAERSERAKMETSLVAQRDNGRLLMAEIEELEEQLGLGSADIGAARQSGLPDR